MAFNGILCERYGCGLVEPVYLVVFSFRIHRLFKLGAGG
jgi:hypothetical protein